jgi:hypothetical protein
MKLTAKQEAIREAKRRSKQEPMQILNTRRDGLVVTAVKYGLISYPETSTDIMGIFENGTITIKYSTHLTFNRRITMTFSEFKAAYHALFDIMMSYHPNEVGSLIYAEKMAEMADTYPQWAETVETTI